MKRPLMDVLVIGAGMYVCGRGTSGFGTVLPALIEAHRDGLVGRILIAATKASSIKSVNKKLYSLNRKLGTSVKIKGFPSKGENKKSYLEALQELKLPACVIVVVPDHLHFSIAKEVIQRRLPLMITKPLTPILSEGKQLVNLAKKLGVYGVVDFHKRWDWANLKLCEAVREERLGKLLYGMIEYSQRRNIPEKMFRGWVHKTNVFQYLGVHYVDIIAYALNARPKRAMAVGQYGHLKKSSIQTYDSIEAFVEWDLPRSTTPFLSAFLTNWIDPDKTSAMSYQSLKLIGTRGRYESDQKNRGLQLITEQDGIQDINPYFVQTFPAPSGTHSTFKGYGIDSIRTFLEDVRALYEKEKMPADLELCRPTLRQALISTAVVEAVNGSLASDSQWISVKH